MYPFCAFCFHKKRFKITLTASINNTTSMYPPQPVYRQPFLCTYFFFKSFLSVRISFFVKISFFMNSSLSFFLCENLFICENLLFFMICENFFFISDHFFFLWDLWGSFVTICESLLFLWNYLFASYSCGLWRLATKAGSTLRLRFSAEILLNGLSMASHWFELEKSASYGIWTLHDKLSTSETWYFIRSATELHNLL